MSNPFGRELIYPGDFKEEAQAAQAHWGRSDRHQTGVEGLDDYLYGGYGMVDGYDIVVLHGSYKVGKSTIGLNMLTGAIKAGAKVGIFALEDAFRDVTYRLSLAMDDPNMEGDWLRSGNVRYLPKRRKNKGRWSLQDMIDEIERWYVDDGFDIIYLDHIQFMFDNAESNHDYGQWAAQNTFMHDLNELMDRVKKTIIVISQENREKQIAGSIGIPRAATKLIAVGRPESMPSHMRAIKLEPGRHTPERDYVFNVEVRNGKVYPSHEQPNVAKKGTEF